MISSAKGAYEHVAAGLTEEITTAVARLGSVRMPSRNSVRRYKGRDEDARQIGQQLGVDSVLEGASQVEGGRLRVSVALVDARDGLRLWSEDFARPLGDLVEVQRSIAEAIVNSLNLLRTTQRALVRPHSRNAEAYQHYLRATYLANGDSGDLGPAIDLFRAATVADPDYALAWASLSLTLTLRVHWGFARADDVTQEAEAAARRALALDPTLAEAHQADARVQALFRHNLPAAERAFQRAIGLDPAALDLREDYATFVLSPRGRLEEARAQLERGLAIDAQDMSTRVNLAQVLSRMGELDGAERLLMELHALASESPSVLVRLGNLAALRGRFGDAVRRYEAAATAIRSSWVLGHLGWGLARAGRTAEARAILEQLRRGPFPGRDGAMAAVALGLGDHETALAALERAADEHAPEALGLMFDIRYGALRDQPRFRAVVRQVDGPLALEGPAAPAAP